MEIERFQEEVEIIEKEMFHYLEYYTKKCIPGLYSERAKLEKLLGGNVVPHVLKAIERIFLILVVYGSYTTVGLFKGT